MFALITMLALLTMLPLVTTAYAETSKKIPIMFIRTGTFFTLGTDVWNTDGDTYHTRGSIAGYMNYTIVGPGIALVNGTSSAVVNQNWNIHIGLGEQRFDSEITFKGGTFEGGHNVRGNFTIYTSGTFAGLLRGIDTVTKGVWHGTGAYLGWTLVMDTATGLPVTGYLLIPKSG